MVKLITKLPYNIKLYVIYKLNYSCLFVFGRLGFFKYKLKRNVVFSVKSSKIKIMGFRSIFYTYIKVLKNFYSWVSIINKKTLNLKGVGFKYKLQYNNLYLILGYSHLTKLSFCKNIKLNLITNKCLYLYSIDLFLLNRYVYILKKTKRLDVYKGKGLLVEGEKIIKKEGKKALF